MHYNFLYQQSTNKYLEIECIIDNHQRLETLVLELPAWRPGRYELANFAKNIQRFEVYKGETKTSLPYEKVGKDTWYIQTEGAETVRIRYNFYANTLNSGSTFINAEQLYVNPCNCCFFVEAYEQEAHTLTLDVPSDFQVACSLEVIEPFHYKAIDFHELADSPFIASATLQHHSLVVQDITFHIWFQGIVKPEWKKILSDFYVFIDEQLNTMGSMPVDTYHFMYQITPYEYYHGVEHLKSTIITLGPGYKIFKRKGYENFLGISSHELFHVWNIKTIRPEVMLPYDYKKENYSPLGYIYEGITTYLGDLFLYRSGVFSEFDFFAELQTLLQRHFSNYGRLYRSVAESSIDNWLDGYEKGVPHRKTNIYTEGALIAFMMDIQIRKLTDEAYSLDDLVCSLYQDYALKGKGYTQETITQILTKLTQSDWSTFFASYVYGTQNFRPLLEECFDYVGCEILDVTARKLTEGYFGFSIELLNGAVTVTNVIPESPAMQAHIKEGDSIIAINSIPLENNLNEWLGFFKEEGAVELTIKDAFSLRTVILNFGTSDYNKIIFATKLKQPTEQQAKNYYKWTKRSLQLTDKVSFN